ncbi:MAG TPA: glycosyltransferase [Thermoleophilaceae bacterium]|nr:glycosyltransferase [Thermoleophilaceae bacterium]
MRPEENLRGSFRRSAIVHDWLTIPGGSEKVLFELLELLPDAELFTAVYDRSRWPTLHDRDVNVSFIDRLPAAHRHYPKLLPLMNMAFESFDLSGFDLVVSSSHSCAKNVLTGSETLHLCYCHTPMRHAWEPRHLNGELGPGSSMAARMLLGRLRRNDLLGASRPDLFVANSNHVAARIRKHYRRDALVIPPPVNVERHLHRPRNEQDYYLVLGRVVPYKKVDLAVGACATLGRPVKVVGEGRGLEAARAAAGPDAEFLGYLPDEDVAELLSGARALLFPGEEDFGIVPVEAQAAGVPVIAYREGGIQDTVLEGETGVFHAEQTVTSVASAILQFESMQFDEYRIRANARRFGSARFRAEMTDVLLEHAPERAAT